MQMRDFEEHAKLIDREAPDDINLQAPTAQEEEEEHASQEGRRGEEGPPGPPRQQSERGNRMYEHVRAVHNVLGTCR